MIILITFLEKPDYLLNCGLCLPLQSHTTDDKILPLLLVLVEASVP
jgi:hypothetical protein